MKVEREPLARPEPSAKKKVVEENHSQQQQVASASSDSHRKLVTDLAIPAAEPAAPAAHAQSGTEDLSTQAIVEAAPNGRNFTNSSSNLSLQERARVVQFFDGASVRELLLESAAVVAVPDLFVPEILNGFPHSFQNLSQDGVINLLAVFAVFVRGAGAGINPDSTSDLSVEVRQTLTVNARGERVMRKTLLVDGVRCSFEEQAL